MLDKETMAELFGKILAALEALNKSDDQLAESINSLRSEVKDLRERLVAVETKVKLYWWVTTAICSSVAMLFTALLKLI